MQSAFEATGNRQPWPHQVELGRPGHKGQSAVISTGTASGKSLAYLMPCGARRAHEPRSAAFRSEPPSSTSVRPKALANDQRRRLSSLDVDGLRVATYDGDTPGEEREWIRNYANVVLTNPDMLHHSMLPGHARWASFLRRLQFVVIDELHHYRGLFGAHVAARAAPASSDQRSVRVDTDVLLASATASDPETTATRLTGYRVHGCDR